MGKKSGAELGTFQALIWGTSLIGTQYALHESYSNKTKVTIMRTLLRHASTGQYFQSLDTWTPDRDNAHDFGLIGRAVKFARKVGLPDLELIVSVDDPQQISNTPFEVFWRKILRARSA